MDKVHVWTDGGQDGSNPGPGAWAAILTFNGVARVVCEHVNFATNNALETLAVVGALHNLNRPCMAIIHSDSQYVQNGIRKIVRSNGKKILKTNEDCWFAYKEAAHGHTVIFEKTEGHAYDQFNNLADALAAYCAKSRKDFNFMTSVNKLKYSNYRMIEKMGPNTLMETEQ